MGEDIVFFRDTEGKTVALRDLCAHRGAKLSLGVCHFPGTVSCPYHGWTYNSEGRCVAALVEGPQSHIPKTGAQIPTKRVREFRGIVWVWIGDGEPVPLEEDIPEEFLDPQVTVFIDVRTWPVNWRPLIENAIDGHAPYVHRNSVLAILFGLGPLGRKLIPMTTRDGKGIALRKENAPPIEQDYPNLGRFPRLYRRKYLDLDLSKEKNRPQLYRQALHAGNCLAGNRANSLSETSIHPLGRADRREFCAKLLLAFCERVQVVEGLVCHPLLSLSTLGYERELLRARPRHCRPAKLQL